MKYSLFDRYAWYLKGAALMIALLTYWRFRELDLSAVYAYVAQGDVIHSILLQSVAVSRSIVWDFFGLIDRFVTPHSIKFLRFAGLIILVLDLYLISAVVEYILGQKFWGFLGVFLGALSPFAIVAAVSGGSAAAAVALMLLFILALYRNQYVYAGVLSGICFAANLPGLIMFLVTVLDLLQNLQDKKQLLTKLLTSAAGFLIIMALAYFYSVYSGSAKVFSVPVSEHDLTWPFSGAVPLLIANVLNVAGIAYIVVKKRYDAYRTHFHTLMMWIASLALSIAQPTTANLLVALAVSIILAMFFLQGFNSLWKIRLISPDTFVFLFVILFLFGDLYSNNLFLKGIALENSFEKNEAVGDVVNSIAHEARPATLVSNFVPAELSVKLGRKVYEVGDGILPVGNFVGHSGTVIYVARRESKIDTLTSGCRQLSQTRLIQNNRTYFVQVVECRKEHE